MKMEIPILSDDAGMIREVLVAENELIEQGQAAAILED
jgi:biotin carboxyl carrier protein